MTAAVLDTPQAPVVEEWVTLGAAAKLAGRTLGEFLALREVRSYKKGFPEIRTVKGQRKVRRADVWAWAVDVGCITPTGEALIGYEDIARLLGVAEQTARGWERDRKANVAEHGAPSVDDLPDPYGYFWAAGAAARAMWRRDAIVVWNLRDRRPSKTGRWKRTYRPRK